MSDDVGKINSTEWVAQKSRLIAESLKAICFLVRALAAGAVRPVSPLESGQGKAAIVRLQDEIALRIVVTNENEPVTPASQAPDAMALRQAAAQSLAVGPHDLKQALARYYHCLVEMEVQCTYVGRYLCTGF